MSWLQSYFTDYTLVIVTLGASLLGLLSGVVGSFAILKKQGLLGDAISHASLPGIALIFILFETKNSLLLLLGALFTGVLASWAITVIIRNSHIKMDSAMALILSVFFGGGIVAMTYIQKMPNANQAGLEKYIFGQASSLLKSDIFQILGMTLVVLLLIMLFWKELKLFTFDREFAQSLGFSTRVLSALLSLMIVTTIVFGLSTVGVVMMSALLVIPGVAARQWTNNFHVMLTLAAIFGAISGAVGTFFSTMLKDTPTGPAIVLVISCILVISLLFSPQRGLIWKMISESKIKQDFDEDLILFDLYALAMNHKNKFHCHPINAIKPTKPLNRKVYRKLMRILENLQDKGFVKKDYFDCWAMTEEGIAFIDAHPMKRREL